MLAASDTDISTVMPIFTSLDLRVSFLVPTETAMGKSIIDATFTTREYFTDLGLHDYLSQGQGVQNKANIQSFFVEPGMLIETTTSLYRPNTKNGDPRIWFYDLKKHANPNNLLAIATDGSNIYIINCSRPEILTSFRDGSSPLFSVSGLNLGALSNEASELLAMLKGIGRKGWVPSLRAGDTGVGYTLETMLGIVANSSKSPDYKGIEIKTSRTRSSNQTLFGKTPNWKLSRLKGSKEILKARGRFSKEKNRNQLFHSIHAHKANSYGLQLQVDFENNLLIQHCNVSEKRVDDVLWELATLKDALRAKHGQTMWVKSKSRLNASGDEEFFYHAVEYTRGPNISAFPVLIEAGAVFVDYTIKELPSKAAKDQGYLFRMNKNNLSSLFGEPKIFSLSDKVQN